MTYQEWCDEGELWLSMGTTIRKKDEHAEKDE